MNQPIRESGARAGINQSAQSWSETDTIVTELFLHLIYSASAFTSPFHPKDRKVRCLWLRLTDKTQMLLTISATLISFCTWGEVLSVRITAAVSLFVQITA